MRNPIKAYWFISLDRYKGSSVYSRHYRIFSTHRWAKPADVLTSELEHFCAITGADDSDFIITSFGRH